MPELHSPFEINQWRLLLRNHPDRKWIHELLMDIEHGVNIGFDQNDRTHYICDNHLSAKSNRESVAKELERELDLNRKVGPFLVPPFPAFVGSPMGAIRKKHSDPPKWRIIQDLSWPAGQSVNDGISKDSFSCVYDTLDSAITKLKQMGLNALMSKLDLSDAFRHILVRKSDWELLGTTWPIEVNGQIVTGYFFDAFLPFGLRSSPALFLKFIKALKFVMQERHAETIWNYLDDFFTCGPCSPSTICSKNLDIMLKACGDLGFKVNPAKTVKPTTVLTLLGIELDSARQEARIDESRLEDTMSMLAQWETRRSCKKRQLQSLIGKLHFICKVCRPGRTFLRRMINLLSRAAHPTHHIRLTASFKKDVQWWMKFLPDWNGCSFFHDDQWILSTSLQLFTDASRDAFGAYFMGDWLMGSFKCHKIPLSRSIAFKELYAICAALSAWAYKLSSKNILFHCDNMSVVHILTTGTSKCNHIMSLVRYLFYVCATHNIMLRVVHIAGVDNSIADSLSRLQIDKFRQLDPQASRYQTFLPRINLDSFN